VLSCGSPTPTARASPRSPPTPHPADPAASCPTWSYAIAAARGPRTGCIRCAKDTGLTNLPLHGLDQNRIWCALVALACEITAWTQMLALAAHPARRWEPKRLRLRLFSIAARLARSGRRTVLHLATHAPWAALLDRRPHHLARPGQIRLTRSTPDPTTSTTGPWNRRPERPRPNCHAHQAQSPPDGQEPANTRS
jgi:hypothetical protein